MKKTVLLLLCALSPVTEAMDGLRCGHNLVSAGNHKTEVLFKCGQPSYIDERWEYFIFADPSHGITEPHWDRARPAGVEAYISVRVEEWVYNFGPHRFMQLLRFENSLLTQVHSLGYGY